METTQIVPNGTGRQANDHKSKKTTLQGTASSKLVTIDGYHAKLLHHVGKTFKASHSRAAQFCLDYVYEVKSDIRPFRTHSQRHPVDKVFIPFAAPYYCDRRRLIVDQRTDAEEFARTMFMAFTVLLKSAIRQTVDDLLNGKLSPTHPLVTHYFPKGKMDIPTAEIYELIRERVDANDPIGFDARLNKLAEDAQ